MWPIIQILTAINVTCDVVDLIKRSIKLSRSTGLPLIVTLDTVSKRIGQEKDAEIEMLKEKKRELLKEHEKLRSELDTLGVVHEAVKQQNRNN
jgi:uncharacterized protein (DUF3084 family)